MKNLRDYDPKEIEDWTDEEELKVKKLKKQKEAKRRIDAKI